MAVVTDKLQAMVAWPTPISVSKLRGFLGLMGYYLQFFSGYAAISSPLTDFLKHTRCYWIIQATTKLQALKDVMVQLPILGLPYFSLPFMTLWMPREF